MPDVERRALSGTIGDHQAASRCTEYWQRDIQNVQTTGISLRSLYMITTRPFPAAAKVSTSGSSPSEHTNKWSTEEVCSVVHQIDPVLIAHRRSLTDRTDELLNPCHGALVAGATSDESSPSQHSDGEG